VHDLGAGFQPGIEFTLPVDDGIGLTVGTWGSMHTEVTGGGSNPSSWYEQDVYASLGFAYGDFSFSTGLTYYTYPSAAVNSDITEAFASVSYDDSELFGDFAFNPYLLVAVELQNNVGSDENSYAEVGGAFTLPTEGTVIEDWSWSVPFAIGMSLQNYYNDATGAENFIGFYSVGLQGSIAMANLIGYDQWFGAWDLNAGVTLYLLNSDVAGISKSTTDENDNYQFVLNVGVSRDW